MKFDIIVIDPPYSFSDKLKISSTKRGSEDNYDVMSIDEIKAIPIQMITNDDAVLCLWVVGSQLQEGLDIMKAYGFTQKQVWVWVKTKKNPLADLIKAITKDNFLDKIKNFDINSILNFKMGHLFRQTHELCLIGTKGKIYNKLLNKSQRSVGLSYPGKHSTKTELLQDKLDIMFSDKLNKIEAFGRRNRPGWVVIGNQSPNYAGISINDIITFLSNIVT